MASELTVVAEAVGVGTSGARGKDRAKAIELAMSAAVGQAALEGVTDQDQIRARMLAARDAVIADLLS